MGTDSLLLNIKIKIVIKDLKNPNKKIEFSNLNKSQVLYSKKKEKGIANFRIENSKTFFKMNLFV